MDGLETADILLPKQARYQLRYTGGKSEKGFSVTGSEAAQLMRPVCGNPKRELNGAPS
jgi:hypothetical protein